MLKEVDFSNGVRGKHSGRTRVVGPVSGHKAAASGLARKISKIIEADLKTRDHFSDVLDHLDKSERDEMRQAWLEKIDDVLISAG